MRKFIQRASNKLLKLHTAAHNKMDAALAKSNAQPYVLKPYSQDASTRIVHINGNFLVGGTTQLMVDLIERLSNSYCQEVVVPDAPKPRPYEPVVLHEVSLMEMQPLYEALSRQRPAIVHIQYWVREGDEFHAVALWYDAIFRMCERLLIPVVQNVNVPTTPHPSPAVVHNVYVSEYVRAHFDVGGVASSVIHPGSDFTHFAAAGDPPDEVIGMVYRLDPDKLDERSIEVFIQAVRRRPSLKCLIVGDGHYLDYYRHRVSEAGLSAHFTFPGVVSYADLPSWYRRMSVFVAPVHNESFGQVTPFAMSMGLPVAGFDIGALSEQLGSTATLAPSGDLTRLAGLIVALCDNKEQRLKLGRENRARAHALFSVEKMTERYRALYDSLLGDEPTHEQSREREMGKRQC